MTSVRNRLQTTGAGGARCAASAGVGTSGRPSCRHIRTGSGSSSSRLMPLLSNALGVSDCEGGLGVDRRPGHHLGSGLVADAERLVPLRLGRAGTGTGTGTGVGVGVAVGRRFLRLLWPCLDFVGVASCHHLLLTLALLEQIPVCNGNVRSQRIQD